MSNSELFLLALGIFSSIAMVVSAIAIKRGRLLTFSLIANLLCVAQYTLVGSHVGMIMCAVGVTRSVIFLLSEKYHVFNHWLFLFGLMSASTAGFLLFNNWNDLAWHSFLPLAGSMLSSLAVFFVDVRKTKMTLLATGVVWLFYEFSLGLYSQMVGESLTLVGNFVALSVLLAGYRKGVPVDDIKTVEEQAREVITTSIPVITGKIAQISSQTRPIPIQR